MGGNTHVRRGSDASLEDNGEDHSEEEEGSSSSATSGKDGGVGGAPASSSSDSESSASGSDSESDDDGSSNDEEDSDDSDDDTEEVSTPSVSDEEMKLSIALASRAVSKTFGWKSGKEDDLATTTSSSREAAAVVDDGTQKESFPKRKQPIQKPTEGGPTNEENPLSSLLPGYTAPLRLQSKQHRNKHNSSVNTTLAQLRQRAELTDRSTANFCVNAKPSSSHADSSHRRSTTGFIPSSSTVRTVKQQVHSFKMGSTKKQIDPTSGPQWFNMTPTPLTDQLKTDIAVIQNRNYLDPKRFYKSSDKNPSSKKHMIQLGTVIEGNTEFYSSRLTKKQRRTNLTAEIMADGTIHSYATNKFRTMQREKDSKTRKAKGGGRKGWKSKGRRGY